MYGSSSWIKAICKTRMRATILNYLKVPVQGHEQWKGSFDLCMGYNAKYKVQYLEYH